MGKKSKDKGYRGERYFVDGLNKGGVAAKRVPLSGALVEMPGDITLPWLGRKKLGEAKLRADGFKEIYKWLKDRDVLFIKADRKDGLAVMRLADFAELLKAANDAADEKEQAAFLGRRVEPLAA